ncbi:MAG: hypothetical protein D3918_16810, partial [Candidatus Electrothrix sp. AX2]|nr:hypothetical protein [Candidatus Electrothrix gigas]
MTALAQDAAVVRILIDDQSLREPKGAGFLVTPQHIITCAHVVNDALGRNGETVKCPDSALFFDFPLLPGHPLARAKILHWFPMRENAMFGELEDIAVLELLPGTFLPDEVRPASVVLPHEQSFFDKRVRLCGFPVNAD